MRNVQGKLNPKTDCINVVAGDLQIYWANNLLSVWREDCQDIGVCIGTADEAELHVTACGCDAVLGSYSNTEVLLRIGVRNGVVVPSSDRFGAPFCPDCHTSMVKTRVQNEEGDWARHWLCKCKVGPPGPLFKKCLRGGSCGTAR